MLPVVEENGADFGDVPPPATAPPSHQICSQAFGTGLQEVGTVVHPQSMEAHPLF